MNTETRQTYRLVLPWCYPPLTGNQRLHWAHRHRVTAEVRRSVA